MIDAFINSLLLVIGLLFIILAIVTSILPRGWTGRVLDIAFGVWLSRKL